MAKAPPKPAAALPPVLVVAGEELFLRNQHLAEIIRGVFGGEDPGMGLVRIDPTPHGQDATARILDELRTPSMFAPKKLVIVDPVDVLFKKADEESEADDRRLTNREMLENYVAAPAEGATLVLVARSWPKSTRLHKAIDKVGGVKWAESIKAYTAPGWIARSSSSAPAR